MRITRFSALTPIALTVAFAACAPDAQEQEPAQAQEPAQEQAQPEETATKALGAEELQNMVAEVREATAAFQNMDTAMARGYTDQYPEGCAESEEGVQGIHYLNPSLVDGEVDVLQPELVMYEPQEDGSMELVGVDYVIPFDQWQGEGAPTLAGQPMARNEPLSVWAIHIWAWRDNSSGLFAMWNPDVSCEFAK